MYISKKTDWLLRCGILLIFIEVKWKFMNTVETEIKETPGVQFAKAMLESQRQTAKEALEEYETNPDLKKIVEELKQRNAERPTPVRSL
jgi:copper chaperone CopZ